MSEDRDEESPAPTRPKPTQQPYVEAYLRPNDVANCQLVGVLPFAHEADGGLLLYLGNTTVWSMFARSPKPNEDLWTTASNYFEMATEGVFNGIACLSNTSASPPCMWVPSLNMALFPIYLSGLPAGDTLLVHESHRLYQEQRKSINHVRFSSFSHIGFVPMIDFRYSFAMFDKVQLLSLDLIACFLPLVLPTEPPASDVMEPFMPIGMPFEPHKVPDPQAPKVNAPTAPTAKKVAPKASSPDLKSNLFKRNLKRALGFDSLKDLWNMKTVNLVLRTYAHDPHSLSADDPRIAEGEAVIESAVRPEEVQATKDRGAVGDLMTTLGINKGNSASKRNLLVVVIATLSKSKLPPSISRAQFQNGVRNLLRDVLKPVLVQQWDSFVGAVMDGSPADVKKALGEFPDLAKHVNYGAKGKCALSQLLCHRLKKKKQLIKRDWDVIGILVADGSCWKTVDMDGQCPAQWMSKMSKADVKRAVQSLGLAK